MKLILSMILLVLCLLTFITSYPQTDLCVIKLDIHQSLRIPFNQVNIKMLKRVDGFIMNVKSIPGKNDEEWHYSKIDTTYIITLEQFVKIENLIKELSLQEIFFQVDNSLVITTDGEGFTLGLGTYMNEAKIIIWSPKSDTKKRKLDKFVNICTEIILLAKLNPEDLF